MITHNLPPIVLPEADAARHIGGPDVLAMLRKEYGLKPAIEHRGRQPRRYDRTALEAAWQRYNLSRKPTP